MIEKEQIFRHMGYMVEKIPCNLYWLDLNLKIIGANQKTLDSIGAKRIEDILGKTVYNIYPKNIADDLTEHFNQVISTQTDIKQEHTIKDMTTGRLRIYVDTVSPILDNSNVLIGIIGTSIETTAEKEAERLKHENQELEAQNKLDQIIREKDAESERLRLENENHKVETERLRLENKVHKLEKEAAETIAKEQQSFRKIADRVAHDLRPPVASITYLAKSQASRLPEDERITLRDAGNRINDLANYLLSYYKPSSFNLEVHKPSALLISGAITEILSEKRLQYPNLPIKFINQFQPDSYFTFISIPIVAFKSMLSNLINNSVDALGKKEGEVIVGLECQIDTVKISIQDNGKGMLPELVDKIINNITITSGKQDGHGIGLTQVRETLVQNGGSFVIDSTPGIGTKIILAFPKLIPPVWICEKLELNNDDVIIVVDDDQSIHGSWDSRFAVAATHFKLKHFNQGNDVIDFINTLPLIDKQKIFLLTDYELLEQGLNGLDIINKTGIKRSVLVTSRYEDKQVQELALATNTKILPKLLALEVPILVTGTDKTNIAKNQDTNNLLTIELIVVDDYEPLTNNLMKTVLKGRNVAVFNDVHSFLDNVYKYKRDSKIIMDNNYNNYYGDIEGINLSNTGFSLAHRLHNDGFTNLYLASGDKFSSVPNYLKVIAKHHYNDIEALLDPHIVATPQPDILIRAEIFREAMVNFMLANYRDQRGYLSGIDYLVYKTQKGQAKSKASNMRLNSINKVVNTMQNQIADDRDTIRQAENILNGRDRVDLELFKCEISEHVIYELLSYALKDDAHLLDNFDIRRPSHFLSFIFLGNKIIVDVIISILLRYAANQIYQQKGVGNIHIDTDSTGGHNHLLINYTLQMLDGNQFKSPLSFDNLPDYSENLEFCRNIMRLFGGDISLNPTPDEGVQIILCFPRISKTNPKAK